MAWGIDDLINWIQNAVEAGQVVSGDKPATNIPAVNNAVTKGIVNPANIVLQFSGAKDAYRGVKPGASGKDQALGLLALAGMVGGFGAADDIGRTGGQLGRGAKLKVLDMFGPKETMYHASGTQGLKKILPSIAPSSGTAYGIPKPYVYVADKQNVLDNLLGYIKSGGSMGFDDAGKIIDTRTKTGSIYKLSVPKHRLESYGGESMKWAKRSVKPAKVKQEFSATEMPRAEFMDALKKFIK